MNPADYTRRKMDRLVHAAILLILGVGFFLRTHELDVSSLWLDEIHSIERASEPNWQTMRAMLVGAGHAPLYERVVLHLWIHLGTDGYTVRFPSVIFGVLNIAVAYALGRRLFGSRVVGLLSALLLSISSLHIYYSQEARMYTLATLLATLGSYFFFRAQSGTGPTTRWKDWCSFAMYSALGLYTHYLTAFMLLAILVFGCIKAVVKRNWNSLSRIVLVYATVGLLFVPWLPTLYSQLQISHLGWIPPVTWLEFLDVLSGFFVNRTVLGCAYPILLASLLSVLLFGLLSYIRDLAHRRTTPNRSWSPLLFVSACAGGPTVILAGISLYKPFIVDRYLLIVVPAASILLALAISRMVQHRIAIPIISVLVIGSLVSAYSTANTEWKENWRGASSYISENTGPDDIIVLISESLRPTFTHYYSGPLEVYGIETNLTGKNDIADAFNRLGQPSRMWLIRAERFPPSKEIDEHITLEYGPRLVYCRSFGGFYDVEVCLYEIWPEYR